MQLNTGESIMCRSALAVLLAVCLFTSTTEGAGRGSSARGRTSTGHTVPRVTPPASWRGPSKVITHGTNHYINPPKPKTR